MKTTTPLFESEVCSRCGGTGSYSYCSQYGTTCFKCKGRKMVLTVRGKAAADFARSLRMVAVSDVQPGSLLWVPACPMGTYRSGWHPVLTVTPNASSATSTAADGTVTNYTYTLLETSVCGSYEFHDSKVQCIADRSKLAECLEQALQYQATLTKQGKPRKVATKAN